MEMSGSRIIVKLCFSYCAAAVASLCSRISTVARATFRFISSHTKAYKPLNGQLESCLTYKTTKQKAKDLAARQSRMVPVVSTTSFC